MQVKMKDMMGKDDWRFFIFFLAAMLLLCFFRFGWVK
jgi:hypothetical protein